MEAIPCRVIHPSYSVIVYNDQGSYLRVPALICVICMILLMMLTMLEYMLIQA